MSRELFKLRKFKLKDRQDVEVAFDLNGKEVSEKFTEPVHPHLVDAFAKFKPVFQQITGMDSDNSEVKEVDLRGVNVQDKGEFTTVILIGGCFLRGWWKREYLHS